MVSTVAFSQSVMSPTVSNDGSASASMPSTLCIAAPAREGEAGGGARALKLERERRRVRARGPRIRDAPMLAASWPASFCMKSTT